ncbi:MAG: hypothetical protein JWO94_3824 [Verrucomicrobiaceae bacterium]|nr:hypothetical protein [Verrucomicrobiaceae bacterium]
MFKKVLQSISKSLNRQSEPPIKPPTPARSEAPRPAAPSFTPPPPQPAATVGPAPVRAAPPATPEGLLGIEPKMNKEQIRDHLKLLYRRYNRAASSLDNATRSEADSMLDAIVAVREKNFGEI